MFSPGLVRKLFFFMASLLLTINFIQAQEKDEKLAEQKKLEQKILKSKTVAEKLKISAGWRRFISHTKIIRRVIV
jgi:uncharacterized protein YnzC (UPF0291/DUF896 family)